MVRHISLEFLLPSLGIPPTRSRLPTPQSNKLTLGIGVIKGRSADGQKSGEYQLSHAGFSPYESPVMRPSSRTVFRSSVRSRPRSNDQREGVRSDKVHFQKQLPCWRNVPRTFECLIKPNIGPKYFTKSRRGQSIETRFAASDFAQMRQTVRIEASRPCRSAQFIGAFLVVFELTSMDGMKTRPCGTMHRRNSIVAMNAETAACRNYPTEFAVPAQSIQNELASIN